MKKACLVLFCLLTGVVVACSPQEEHEERVTETLTASLAPMATPTAVTPTTKPSITPARATRTIAATKRTTTFAMDPTKTLVPVCTPPPCGPDEVYYCPGECPGGCGTVCATPTALAMDPTRTLMPVCTPPPCGPDEVYYCPGECPGGCGTVCATPTFAPATLPVIQSFSASRTEIVEGEPISLTWQATGGDEAYISWVGSNALLAGPPGPLDPDGGAVSVAPTGDGDVWLTVMNDAGSVESHIQLTIECPYEWVPPLAQNPPSHSCPQEAESGAAAQQAFEHGFMLWFGPSREIYVFYEAGRLGSYPAYSVQADTFSEGDPESDPAIVPPEGLYQPVRGFGAIWRTDPRVRDGLGWATAPEQGFQTWRQRYLGQGLHNAYTLLQGIEGTIYYLTAFGGVWEVYEP